MSGLTGNRSGPLGLGLAVLCVAQFVVVLDATIVATALPAIGADLGFGSGQLSWVITAYTVVLAGGLILGGRTADLFGAGRVFRIGLVVFSTASLACALAWSPSILIIARVLQGTGAALLSPAALAVLNQLVQRADARRRALGWWTAAGAGGGASGWVLGGLITEVVGWPWIFAVNAPIGLVALLVSRRALPGDAAGGRQRTRSRGDLDLSGAVLVTAGIALGALGLSRLAEDLGRLSGWLQVVLSVVALTVFVRHEGRTPRPLIPADLLRVPGVLGGNLTAAALTASTTPAMLTAVLYVQDTLRLSPARGSLLFPAFNLAVIGGSLLGPRALTRIGARRALVSGFALVVTGIALLLALPPAGLPLALLAGSFAVMGLGLGTASVASTTAGTAQVPGASQGVAAGLLNSNAQLGTALGLALTSPLVASAAPMVGYRLGFVAAGLIGVLGAVCAVVVRPVSVDEERPTRSRPDAGVSSGTRREQSRRAGSV